MSLKISTAVRAGSLLVPGTSRETYFELALNSGALLACLTGCAYLGSYPTPEAIKEKDRIYSLLTFGDGKIHTAAHGITKRLYAAFPELGRNIKLFPLLIKLGGLRLSKDDLARMSLFGYLTTMFKDPARTIESCVLLLERVNL